MRAGNLADDYDVDRSRATTPLFYRAPYPAAVGAREYQLSGVEYVLERRNALIGDAPGVGKTAQGIMVSNALGAKHTLVIVPASLRLNWQKEIWRWSSIPNVSTYVVGKSRDGVSLEASYVIVSYDLLRNPSILNALMMQRWNHMILDEAHYLKDPKGNQRTRAICASDLLPSVVGRITMLSGTILPNQPIEAYNAIRLLNWAAIDNASLEDFREHYYDFGGGFVRGPVVGRDGVRRNDLHWSDRVRNVPRNLDDLQYRLRKHLMVRRLKEQVLSELPPKQWHPFPLTLTAEIRRALKHPGWKAAERLYDMDAHAFDRGVPIDGEIATARRELGEAKAPAVAEYIEQLLQEGVEKVLVGAWHHSVLKHLRERLGKHGLVFMDGATSNARKQAAVDQFQTDPRVKIILGQMIPLGMGWTLTAAQDAVFAEFDWVPGINEQFLDRLHRIGQAGNVLGHVPVVAGSLDEKLLSSMVEKAEHIHLALDAA